MRTCLLSALLLACCVFTLAAQEKPITSLPDGPLIERGLALYAQGDLIGALPFFEEMTKRHPDSPGYAEGLAFCLSAAARMSSDSSFGALQWKRAGEEAERASRLGDKSQLEEGILDVTKAPYASLNESGVGESKVLFSSAEQAFAHGDMESAFKKYSAAYDLDPHFYEAALFAGDVEFREKNSAQAGIWFARAIVIDPNRETAYRYWGDALDGSGHPDAARDKFIAAIVAEPYNKSSFVGLTNWATRNGYVLRWPDIQLPAAPAMVTKDGKPTINITVDPAMNADTASGAWLAYQMDRATFRTDKFAKAYPNEKSYRHSLKEELSAIETALTVARDLKIKDSKLDPGLKTLMKLQQEGLLEPWIFLCDADQGIAQDYDAYRDGHRQQLTRFISDYLIHQSVKEPGH